MCFGRRGISQFLILRLRVNNRGKFLLRFDLEFLEIWQALFDEHLPIHALTTPRAGLPSEPPCAVSAVGIKQAEGFNA